MNLNETYQASTCREVIENLEKIIARCEAESSPVGYFAALYRLTTIEIVEAAENGLFHDNERMKRMDIIFANRYFDAVNAYFSGQPTTRAWTVAFKAAADPGVSLIQHLFLGMNAHINLDLTVAAAQAAPGDQIEDFKHDFCLINSILESLFRLTEHDIASVWKPLDYLLSIGESIGNALLSFGMEFLRENAWEHTLQLAHATPETYEARFFELDQSARELGEKILNPPSLMAEAFGYIRNQEEGTVAEKIEKFHNSIEELPRITKVG